MIQCASQIFDVDGSGEITVQDLMGRYDASQHPDVGSGKMTAKQVTGQNALLLPPASLPFYLCRLDTRD